MNKTELIKATAKKAEKTIGVTGEVFAALQEVIVETLKAGEDIKVPGLGNLVVKDVPERKAHNPANGNEIVVPAHKTVKAKLAPAVRDAAR